jgi:hypothetical protein
MFFADALGAAGCRKGRDGRLRAADGFTSYRHGNFAFAAASV